MLPGDISRGSSTGRSPSAARTVPSRLREVVGRPCSTPPLGATPLGRCSLVSWGKPWYIGHLMEPPKSEGIEDALKIGDVRPFLSGISGLSIINGILLYKQLRRRIFYSACCLGRPFRKPLSGNCKWCSPNVLALHFGKLVTSTRVWRFSCFPITCEH